MKLISVLERPRTALPRSRSAPAKTDPAAVQAQGAKDNSNSSSKRRLRDMFHIRRDSNQQVRKMSKKGAPIPLPLDRSMAEQAAILFVTQQSSLVRAASQAHQVASRPPTAQSVMASSSASAHTVVIRGPADPATAEITAAMFVQEQVMKRSKQVEARREASQDESYERCADGAHRADELIITWLNNVDEGEFEAQEVKTILSNLFEQKTHVRKPEPLLGPVDESESEFEFDSRKRYKGTAGKAPVVETTRSDASSSTYSQFVTGTWPYLPAPKKREERRADEIEGAYKELNPAKKRQHMLCRSLAYVTAQGSPRDSETLLTVLAKLENSTCSDPCITISSVDISFRKSDLSVNDWKWLRRGNIAFHLHNEYHHRRISDDHLDLILSQLFPEKKDNYFMSPQEYQALLDIFVREGTWCTKSQAQEILSLQTSPEELLAGPHVILPDPVRKISPTYRSLPLSQEPETRGGITRELALQRLVEAMLYQRQEWHGLFYQNASSAFGMYHTAWYLKNNGYPIAEGFKSYDREWTHFEDRLFRVGAVMGTLLERVNAGKLEWMCFVFIRGTLVNIEGQMFADRGDLERFLYSKGIEAGVFVEEIPEILVSHPCYATVSPKEESEQYVEMLAKASRWAEEETARLRQVEAARQAFGKMEKEKAKAGRPKGFRAKVKRGLKKLFGRKKKEAEAQPTFHCVGCMQGERCIE